MKSAFAMLAAPLLAGCVSVTPMTLPLPGTGPMTAPVAGHELQPLGDNLFVDVSASSAQIEAISGHIAAARGQVAQALRSAAARPQIRVCVTPACDTAYGMTTKGLSVLGQRLDISSRAWDHRPTYVHELVHIEMQSPDLLLMRLRRPVPTWFDEGIATLVSGTVGADLTAPECAALAGRKLPTTPPAFTAFTREVGFRTAYGAAACRVKDWVAAGNSTQSAIAKLRAGQGLP